MITIARSFTRVVITGALVATAALLTPAPAAARSDESPKGIWMAGAGSRDAVGTDWGHLTLRDGTLAFKSSTTGWQLAVSEIKRASTEKSDRLVIEGEAGEVYYLTILDAQMSASSPREALKVIQRALRAAAARR